MPQFLENYLLALGGFLFHFLKMWYTSTLRKEGFLNKPMYIWIAMNILATCLLVYIGPTLPPEIIVMSPVTSILMGISGSSVLAGVINIKRPKDIEITTFETENASRKVTVETQTLPPKNNP